MDHVNVRLLRALDGIHDPPPGVLSVQNNTKAQFGRGASWQKRLLFWRMKRRYGEAEGIISLTQEGAEQLVEMDLAEPEQVAVIPNAGLDEAVYEAKEAPLKEGEPKSSDGPLLVACGRLTKQKGYPYLLDAFREVRDQKEAALWILGEGDRRQAIESQIEELGLVDDVSLLGFRDNPFKFMAAADVFVLSSLSEGFGNVIVEAMACGTPVVSTDCPHGPGEIISHEENGLLVPPADAAALSEAILRVLTDDTLSEQLSENGKRRAQDFHASAISQEYLDLFRDIISG
jgi:glycosyltransferase involved in cell wall biosynthesis